jgi:hypothetical protein
VSRHVVPPSTQVLVKLSAVVFQALTAVMGESCPI